MAEKAPPTVGAECTGPTARLPTPNREVDTSDRSESIVVSAVEPGSMTAASQNEASASRSSTCSAGAAALENDTVRDAVGSDDSPGDHGSSKTRVRGSDDSELETKAKLEKPAASVGVDASVSDASEVKEENGATKTGGADSSTGIGASTSVAGDAEDKFTTDTSKVTTAGAATSGPGHDNKNDDDDLDGAPTNEKRGTEGEGANDAPVSDSTDTPTEQDRSTPKIESLDEDPLQRPDDGANEVGDDIQGEDTLSVDPSASGDDRVAAEVDKAGEAGGAAAASPSRLVEPQPSSTTAAAEINAAANSDEKDAHPNCQDGTVNRDGLDAAPEAKPDDELAPKSDDGETGSIGNVIEKVKKEPETKNGYTHACYLCYRKFPSLAKLRKHERKSKMHKTNLKKKKKRGFVTPGAKRRNNKGEDEEDGDGKLVTPGSKRCNDASEVKDEGRKRVKIEDEPRAPSAAASIASSSSRGSRPRGRRQVTALASRASSGPIMVWKCGSCLSAIFDTYDEAFNHETRCARRRARDNRETASIPDENSGKSAAAPVVDAAKARRLREKQEEKRREKKKEDDRLKALGIQVGGKGTSMSASPEDRDKLTEYNSFMLDNVELFTADKSFNRQQVTMAGDAFAKGTSKVKLRAEGVVGIRCIHCRHLPLWERAVFSFMFPGSLKTISSSLHQITSMHFGLCKSLPDGFRDQMKRAKGASAGLTYAHGKIGMKTFLDTMVKKWKLENNIHGNQQGMKFSGTHLVAPNRSDYLEGGGESDSGAMSDTASVVSEQYSRKRPSQQGQIDSAKKGKLDQSVSDDNNSDFDSDNNDFDGDHFGGGYSCRMFIPGDDEKNCSALQVYVRKHCTELFVLTPDDIKNCMGRNQKASPDQVGIRCIYCRLDPVESRQHGSTAIPTSTHGLYDAFTKITVEHMANCNSAPVSVRERVSDLRENGMIGSKAPRTYYHLSAQQVGIENSPKGMRLNHWIHKKFLEKRGQASAKKKNISQAPENSAGQEVGRRVYSPSEIEPRQSEKGSPGRAPKKGSLCQWPLNSVLRIDVDVGNECASVDFYRKSSGIRCLYSGCTRNWSTASFTAGHLNLHNLKQHAKGHLVGTSADRRKAKKKENAADMEVHAEATDVNLSFNLGGADEDDDFSPVHAFARRMLEVFVVSDKSEATTFSREHKIKLRAGRVGLRCIHCRTKRYFPSSIGDIYTKVRHFTYEHLDKCESVPGNIRKKFSKLRGEKQPRKIDASEQYKAKAEEAGLYDLFYGGVGMDRKRNLSRDAEVSDVYASTSEGNEGSENKDTLLSYPSSESTGDHPLLAELIRPEERAMVAKFKYELLCQLRLCYLTDEDRNWGPRKTLPEGLAGVVCKHCSRTKFFAVSYKTFWQSRVCPSSIYAHLLECDDVPAEELAQLKKLDDAYESTARPHNTEHGKIHVLLWSRIMKRAVEMNYMSADDAAKCLPTEAKFTKHLC